MSNKPETTHRDNSLFKVILTDLAGIGCLILVPFIGPLPGPGGIPLIIAGLGFLAQNHEFAQKWLAYVKKHSTSVREIVFPDVAWAKWGWDITAASLLAFGTWGSFVYDDSRILKVVFIVLMASSTTIFMLNRNRIDMLEKLLLKK